MDERDRVEVEREPPRVERETTVINTGERRGGGGALAAVVLLLAVVVILFLFFGGFLQDAADETDINVNVDAPQIEVPDINLDVAPPSEPSQPSEPANKTDG